MPYESKNNAAGLAGVGAAQHIGRLALHASAEGRSLYEAVGFIRTNEMRKELTPGADDVAG